MLVYPCLLIGNFSLHAQTLFHYIGSGPVLCYTCTSFLMLISYHSYDSFADLTSKEPETFLNFIHSPIPCGRVQMCRILRQEEPKGSFELFLDGVAATADISILTARKIPTSGLFSEYRIFRKDKNAPGPLSSDSIVAVVRSNFWGTAFEITSPSLFHLDASLHQDINIGCILYKPNFLGIHGPRRMRILFPYLNSTFTAKSLSCTGSIVHSKVDPTFFSLYKKNLAKNNVLLLKNKQPAWSEGM